MPDNPVPQEIWTWGERIRLDADVGRQREVRIALDLPEPEQGMAYAEDDVILFSGKGGERGEAGKLADQRAQMAARAPTMFRLLEQVLQLGITIPVDLADVIQQNLHRAAPEKYEPPPVRIKSRKTSWDRLLDEDLV